MAWPVALSSGRVITSLPFRPAFPSSSPYLRGFRVYPFGPEKGPSWVKPVRPASGFGGTGWHPTPSSSNTAIPTVTRTADNKAVTVTFPSGGVTVPDEASGKTLRFIILALPQYHTDLTATFDTADGTKTLKLKDGSDQWIPFNGCYMHHIRGAVIPVGLTAELNDKVIWSGDFAAEAWDGVLWNAQRLFAEDLDRIIWQTAKP